MIYEKGIPIKEKSIKIWQNSKLTSLGNSDSCYMASECCNAKDIVDSQIISAKLVEYNSIELASIPRDSI